MTLQCTKSAGHWRVGSGLGSTCPGRGGRKPAKSPQLQLHGGGVPTAMHATRFQTRESHILNLNSGLLVLTAESRHTIFLLYFFDQAWLWKEKLKAGVMAHTCNPSTEELEVGSL